MKIFTEHTQNQGVTYLEHMGFAIGIAARLANTVVAFTLHAIFPFIDIKKELDLEETAKFIDLQNNWIEGRKREKRIETVQVAVLQTRHPVRTIAKYHHD